MNKTIKMLIVTAALFLASLTNVYAVAISANVLDSYVEVGETFDVEIWADAEGSGWELTSFGFDVDDSLDSVLGYAGATFGSLFDDFSDPFNPFNVSGVFNFSDFSSNNVLLSTLSFTADQVGTGSFSLMGLYDMMFYGLFYVDPFADIFDPFADPFPGADISLFASVVVHDVDNGPAPVPEPSTVLLLGSGLVGLAWYGRKRKKA